MREAIGSAFLVNLILIFIAVISALLIGSISYSKAYKVKNRIIYIIEKHDGYDDAANAEIESTLKKMGYSIASGDKSSCTKIYKKKMDDKFKPADLLHGGQVGVAGYDYCVYKLTSGVGTYYSVTTFMHFDVPLIGGLLEFKVNGESALIYEMIDN